MTAAEILARVEAAGVRLRVDGEQLRASPRDRVTEELRALVLAHRAELVAALAPVREPAHADGEPEPAMKPAPERGAECMRCANLSMRVEHHAGTRRVFWWRCEKGHALLEGRNFGERVLLAPPECDASGDWRQWEAGRR